MADKPELHHPWLIAVWPGMGQVAISAGFYLMAKLEMELLAEMVAPELFDIDHMDVAEGVVQASRLPRSRFFVWHDPEKKRDLIVFIGEAQPPLGKFRFCHRIIEAAKEWGVERVFTFAAMATQMNPADASRLFCAATGEDLLKTVCSRGAEKLKEGRISGLNGILLAAAMEAGLEGACLLGEMPHIFAQVPFPKASLAVLRTFSELAGIKVDLEELQEQADAVSKKLGELLAQVERSIEEQRGETQEDDEYGLFSKEEEGLSAADRERIERLFEQSQGDRSTAYELKQELDRLGVFAEYENRFLDLFKKRD
jgi:proteasome assembly chaperone (PAC2) family protein